MPKKCDNPVTYMIRVLLRLSKITNPNDSYIKKSLKKNLIYLNKA